MFMFKTGRIWYYNTKKKIEFKQNKIESVKYIDKSKLSKKDKEKLDEIGIKTIKDGEYVYKSGTSMAAPIVCGALALALEKNPNLRPVELKLLLYDSVSEKIKNLSPAWGILNVDNLIKML